MSPKYALCNICLLLISPFILNSCRDEFNDPNPNGKWIVDLYAPEITLISPKDSAIYEQENLPIMFLVADSFQIHNIKLQLTSLGKPSPGFEMNIKPGTKQYFVDTVYHSNVADTLEFQMLIYSDDSAGNARSKSVSFWMIKP